jgi:hypothetical protein
VQDASVNDAVFSDTLDALEDQVHDHGSGCLVFSPGVYHSGRTIELPWSHLTLAGNATVLECDWGMMIPLVADTMVRFGPEVEGCGIQGISLRGPAGCLLSWSKVTGP